MDWKQIRDQHPNKWVVVEALNAVTRGAERVIDELVLVGVFDHWKSAWQEYT
jgi:hypothetical protein